MRRIVDGTQRFWRYFVWRSRTGGWQFGILQVYKFALALVIAGVVIANGQWQYLPLALVLAVWSVLAFYWPVVWARVKSIWAARGGRHVRHRKAGS